MSTTPEMLTVKRAAEDLGLSPVSIRRAVMRGTLEVVPLDGRTYLVSREEVERYRREHVGRGLWCYVRKIWPAPGTWWIATALGNLGPAHFPPRCSTWDSGARATAPG